MKTVPRTSANADPSGDGIINLLDFTYVAFNWQRTPNRFSHSSIIPPTLFLCLKREDLALTSRMLRSAVNMLIRVSAKQCTEDFPHLELCQSIFILIFGNLPCVSITPILLILPSFSMTVHIACLDSLRADQAYLELER
jgi:hypothetical protein